MRQQATLCFQALKSIKTSEFMPYVVFVAAPPVEILRNMHELALQRQKTNRVKTVSTVTAPHSLSLSRGLFTPPDSDSKPNGYIALFRSFRSFQVKSILPQCK